MPAWWLVLSAQLSGAQKVEEVSGVFLQVLTVVWHQDGGVCDVANQVVQVAVVAEALVAAAQHTTQRAAASKISLCTINHQLLRAGTLKNTHTVVSLNLGMIRNSMEDTLC